MISPAVDRYALFETFTGPFVLWETDSGRLRTGWLDRALERDLSRARLDPRLRPDLTIALRRYFAGEAADFPRVAPSDGTAFQQRCWDACRQIPFGRTCSYGELASRAGASPFAARAVGQALRRNPLPIIVPCHRVLARDGALGGFAGSDDPAGRPLSLKRSLLAHEGVSLWGSATNAPHPAGGIRTSGGRCQFHR